MPDSIIEVLETLMEIDQLKNIERKCWVGVTRERRENSAEHSWHLAMACWLMANYLSAPFNTEKLLKLALIHDLGEIDAGDTFLYGADRDAAADKERVGIARLQALPGNTITDFTELWEEQELGTSKEAQLIKAVDRLLPFMMNMNSQGRTWREHGIRKSQVQQANHLIPTTFPELLPWFEQQLQIAVDNGWLRED